MIQNTNDNTIIFVDDDDMMDYCVLPELRLMDDNGNLYYDWCFTDFYNDAVAANTEFLIRDKNSHILKDKLIGYRGCTKPVNVSYDFDWEMENIEKRAKQRAKDERKKMKASVEKHIQPTVQ